MEVMVPGHWYGLCDKNPIKNLANFNWPDSTAISIVRKAVSWIQFESQINNKQRKLFSSFIHWFTHYPVGFEKRHLIKSKRSRIGFYCLIVKTGIDMLNFRKANFETRAQFQISSQTKIQNLDFAKFRGYMLDQHCW